MSKRAAKPKPATPDLREPTPAEAEAIREAVKARAARPLRAAVAVEQAGAGQPISISNPHADAKGWTTHVTATFGTASTAFADLGLAQLATAASDGKLAINQRQLNAALAMMGAIDPQNELEAAIGAQIIAAHVASLDFLARARSNAGEYPGTAMGYAGAATKLTRTMALLVETLGKHRSGGKQTHEVRYVYVNGPAVFGDGAQAVFGARGGGSAGTKAGQPLAIDHLAGPGAALGGLPMRSEDAERCGLQVASGGRAQALPDARREQPGGPNREGERALSDGASHARAGRGSGPGAGRRQGREGL